MLALVTIISFAAAASALAIQDTQVKNPLPLSDITWIAPPELGNVSFTGSHSEVIAHIAALVPRWQSNETYLDEIVTGTHAMVADAALQKRSNRVNQFCSQWGTAFINTASVANSMDNLKYVLSQYGTGNCMVNPKACGRFSCSYNNALVMCNDNPFPVTIPCQTMATNYLFVISNCMQNVLTRGGDYMVEGQAFYINPSYNVLVKHTDKGKDC